MYDSVCIKTHFFVITGGPGAGKTTLLHALRARGYACVEEVARMIIQEQVLKFGEALPWKNNERYIEKMLERSIKTYQSAQESHQEIIFFDRGILDTITHARLSNLEISDDLHQAAQTFRYNKQVFIAPLWEEIYCQDSERKQTYEEAAKAYHQNVEVYQEYGYELIDLPKACIEKRIEFMIAHIQS